MKPSFQDRILQREVGAQTRYGSVRGIYGDRAWVNDLDIAAELGGHSGCVNALRSVKSFDGLSHYVTGCCGAILAP